MQRDVTYYGLSSDLDALFQRKLVEDPKLRPRMLKACMCTAVAKCTLECDGRRKTSCAPLTCPLKEVTTRLVMIVQWCSRVCVVLPHIRSLLKVFGGLEDCGCTVMYGTSELIVKHAKNLGSRCFFRIGCIDMQWTLLNPQGLGYSRSLNPGFGDRPSYWANLAQNLMLRSIIEKKDTR